MIEVRNANAAAVVINGLALAAVLLGHPVTAIVMVVASSTLVVWALEKVRTHATRETGR